MIPQYVNKYHVVAPVAPDESSLINILMSELNLNVSANHFLRYLTLWPFIQPESRLDKSSTGRIDCVCLCVLDCDCYVLASRG